MSPNNPQSKNNSRIEPLDIVKEMKDSYLDYAMSVIVSRALPDVRDGLKPVQRRILYSMHEAGLNYNVKHRKSATVVGDVLGKYHPHGDASVYDAMARMAQNFSLRYPLIDGQGNWGSIDGDAPAAMRYTEARMARISSELLRDIEKDTADFVPNYDGRWKEPVVLPSAIPDLLLNGTLGIAVGMASNIPPHNLTELIDGLIHLVEHPKATIEDLAKFIKGPDFPTGGLIFNKEDIHQAYASGRGGVVTRGEAEIVDSKTGTQIIISSIPFQVNKAVLVEKIADLVKEKKIEGVRDIRDESDKEGMRIAIDLKQDSYPQKILNGLYKHTELERVYHFNMVALVDGIQPRTLSLKSILEEFIKHRRIVVERRAKFDLKKAEERAHILEGLKKALDHIDAIIKIIKSSADREAAHKNLVKKFNFTSLQATAILEMRLQTLAGLERQKINDELQEKQKLIRELKILLKDPQKILGVVKEEFAKIKNTYGDERRTKIIVHGARTISVEDVIPEEEAILVITKGGYIKRTSPEIYRAQKRGGKGIIGLMTKEEDMVDDFLTVGTHDNILFFTDRGKVYQLKAYEVPQGQRQSRGKSINNFISLAGDEKVTSVLALPKGVKKPVLVLVTKNGVIKKTDASNFEEVRKTGIIALKLQKGDVLKWAFLASSGDYIILSTSQGQAIRFKESDARKMGRTAAGVRAIRLKVKDELIGADVVGQSEKQALLLVVSSKGYGKKSKISDYRLQRRGGSGIKTAKLTAKTGFLVSAKVIDPDSEEVIAISKKGQVLRTALTSIPTLGRQTQGVRIMKLTSGDSIASLTCL
ncbi:MAG: gyrase subunit A protein [Parcubacteria group bacterium GW2011_GWB1_41_6]|nr:MAG: gyrase subunit A protein [Parcubacteria group bacterium GW2011_GWB1_41_6]KKS34042.1 MAG: gyrase subunit A protein [Parcubacteria group bacterium GW2011_GWC2_42_13]